MNWLESVRYLDSTTDGTQCLWKRSNQPDTRTEISISARTNLKLEANPYEFLTRLSRKEVHRRRSYCKIRRCNLHVLDTSIYMVVWILGKLWPLSFSFWNKELVLLACKCMLQTGNHLRKLHTFLFWCVLSEINLSVE